MPGENFQLSYSESVTLCRRVLVSLGAPAGVDEELAQSVAWLASMKYPILHELTKISPMAKFNPVNSACVYTRIQINELDIDADSDGGLFSLPSIVDQIITLRENFVKSKSTVYNLRYPALLVPLLKDRLRINSRTDLSVGKFYAVFSHGEVMANRSAIDSRDFTKHAPCVIYSDIVNNEALGKTVRAEALKLLPPHPKRITVTRKLYQQLKAIALESMVPSTAHSSLMGAGAGQIDND